MKAQLIDSIGEIRPSQGEVLKGADDDEGLTRQCLQIVDLGFRGKEGK